MRIIMLNNSLKTLFLSLLCSLFFSISYCQSHEGNWYGNLNVMGKEIPFGLTFDNESGKLFNPNKKSLSYDIDSLVIIENSVTFFIKKLGLEYAGKWSKDSIVGFWKQAGQTLPLVFTREEIKPKEAKRPQTPMPPFDYHTEEIEAYNSIDSVTLSGTLTLPTNDGTQYPVVILVTGSGPQNRDSEILGHKSFAVIADHLAKQGIGSYRYDDRGVEKSTGTYAGSDLNDFYRDMDAVVKKIAERKEVKKLGILGHSEGGILAPWYASEHKKQIDFIVMMGAPGQPVKEMMHEQRRITYEGAGMTSENIEAQKQLFLKIDEIVLYNSGEEKTKKLRKLFTEYTEKNQYPEKQAKQYIDIQMKVMDGAWYKSFVAINPDDYLKKVRCSVLVIAGGKDVQIPMKENVKAIATSLSKSKPRFLKKRHLKYSKFSNLNHLMQPAGTGMPDEYGQIETTIDREVLFVISDFIKEV